MTYKLIYDSRKPVISDEIVDRYGSKKLFWQVTVVNTFLDGTQEEFDIRPEKKIYFDDLLRYIEDNMLEIVPENAIDNYFTISIVKSSVINQIRRRTARL